MSECTERGAIMSVRALESSIKELRKELDQLTSDSNKELTNKEILMLSEKLDNLIVEYLRKVN